MNLTMGELPVMELSSVEDDDLILIWDSSSNGSNKNLLKLLCDSKTKVIRVGDLKKYILDKKKKI